MQKIINVLALASATVSIAVVGTGAYVYVNKDAIIESVTEKALGGLGGGLGAVLSRGEGRWWAIPTGVVTGAMLGCQIDGG